MIFRLKSAEVWKKESGSKPQNKILLWWINTTKSNNFQDKKMLSITHKIFETNSSFYVKYCTMGKV